jgi:ribonuclease J
MITRRLEEVGTEDAVTLHTYPVGGAFTVGPFRLQSVRVTHSIPEPVALAIGTAAGTVVHSGDWKFDPEPLIGEPTDFATLERLGDAGVLALVCDSTNAHKEMGETSEAHVREAFRRLFAKRRGQVAVCSFSTNVARLASAAVAAAESGRLVAAAGRSLRNSEATARALGLLDGVPELLAEPSHLKGLDRGQTALVCTGGQGEEKAALAKLARGDRRLPSFGPGDTIVLSARIIPGNEESVERVVSALRARGVEVLMGTDTVDGLPLHVSGHPGAAELRRLYGLLRPRFALPVHGTEMHVTAHAALARGAGVEKALVAEEAEVIRVAPGGARVLGRVAAPLLPLVGDGSGNRVPYRLTAALA